MYASKFNTRIRIEVRGTGVDPDYGTAVEGAWMPFCHAWAEVQDTMPSKSEDTKNSLRLASDSARVRIRYRADITSDMRVVELTGRKRTLAICGGPAAIFDRRELEFTVERFSS